jgi:hypothetical protein
MSDYEWLFLFLLSHFDTCNKNLNQFFCFLLISFGSSGFLLVVHAE